MQSFSRRSVLHFGLRSGLLLASCGVFALSAHAQNQKGSKRGIGRKGQSNQRGGPAQPAPAPVPLHSADAILGRPTDTSVTLNLLRYDKDAEAILAYGPTPQILNRKMPAQTLVKDIPIEAVIDDLEPNSQYHFRLRDRDSNELLAEGAFHTQRPQGSEFTFTITADSHLDNNAHPDIYLRTLANIKADRPDFNIDLGDTFMTGKHANLENASLQYLAQRYYFGQLGLPLFLTLGNHDGETAKQRRGGEDNLAVWSNDMRKKYFPNPEPDDFFTGNPDRHPGLGLLQNYYAWTWGNVLFVVLDPYWYAGRDRDAERWDLSLGQRQYRWLENTLANSDAKHKLVFIHQLVGGQDRQGRGGVSAVPFGEWGGQNADGTDGFAKHRPDWGMPIHSMLVKQGVDAVFHGHDHFYAAQERDGIVYQLLPQPAHASTKPPRDADAYGYRTGTILGGSGHMRFKVSANGIQAEFVQAGTMRNRSVDENGKILHSYMIGQRKD